MFFIKNSYEVDFVCFDKDKPMELIQVSYDLENTETLKREVKALEKATALLNCYDCKIITEDMQDEIDTGKLKIKIIPAYKYLLEE